MRIPLLALAVSLVLAPVNALAAPHARLLDEELSIDGAPIAPPVQRRLLERALDTGGGAGDTEGYLVEGLAGCGAWIGYSVVLGLVVLGIVLGTSFGSSSTSFEQNAGVIIIGFLLVGVAALATPVITALAINSVAEGYGAAPSLGTTVAFGYLAWGVSVVLQIVAALSQLEALSIAVSIASGPALIAAQVYAANRDDGGRDDYASGPPARVVRFEVARF